LCKIRMSYIYLINFFLEGNYISLFHELSPQLICTSHSYLKKKERATTVTLLTSGTLAFGNLMWATTSRHKQGSTYLYHSAAFEEFHLWTLCAIFRQQYTVSLHWMSEELLGPPPP
jgi:hypothetical protein